MENQKGWFPTIDLWYHASNIDHPHFFSLKTISAHSTCKIDHSKCLYKNFQVPSIARDPKNQCFGFGFVSIRIRIQEIFSIWIRWLNFQNLLTFLGFKTAKVPLLDPNPDPDSEPGSGSRHRFEYGSNLDPDPDPKHCRKPYLSGLFGQLNERVHKIDHPIV